MRVKQNTNHAQAFDQSKEQDTNLLQYHTQRPFDAQLEQRIDKIATVAPIVTHQIHNTATHALLQPQTPSKNLFGPPPCDQIAYGDAGSTHNPLLLKMRHQAPAAASNITKHPRRNTAGATRLSRLTLSAQQTRLRSERI
jgi:hypothetical protein